MSIPIPQGATVLDMRVLLPVPPEAVWPHVSDAAALSAWSAVTVTPLRPGPSGQPLEAGAERTVRIPILGPLAVTAREVLLEVEPPHRFTYQVVSGGGLRDHLGRIRLHAAEGGTEVLWTVHMVPLIPGVGGLIRAFLRREFEQGFETLRHHLVCAEGA